MAIKSLPADLQTSATILIGNTKYINIKDYSYDSDILQLGDPFACTISDADGLYAGKIAVGDSVKFYLQDPNVSGGNEVQMLTGLVTDRQAESTRDKGTSIMIGGEDLGWHLKNNSGPLWFNLRNVSMGTLLKALLDSSWGFQSTIQTNNDVNRLLKQGLNNGRTAIQLQFTEKAYPDTQPRIQIEPGETPADLIIRFAKRQKLLVNVSSDGYLQIWQPNYTQASSYSFHYHVSDGARAINNIKRAKLSEKLDGIYTDVTCIGTYIPGKFAQTTANPNDGHFRGDFTNHSALSFTHRLTFADQDPLTKSQADGRAKWKAQRSSFDSWTYEIVVAGHSQNGKYYVPDTMCSVADTVNGLNGFYYISAVQYTRNRTAGSETRLTIKKPNLLSAA